MAGVWAASQPAFRDNSLWAQNNGGQLGMQLRFEAGEGETGEGIARIYDYQDPVNEIELPFAFRVAPGTETPAAVDITFTAAAEHESLNFDFGPRTTWRLSETGELLSTGFRQTWRIAMEKDGEAVAHRARIVAAARAERERRNALSIEHRGRERERSAPPPGPEQQHLWSLPGRRRPPVGGSSATASIASIRTSAALRCTPACSRMVRQASSRSACAGRRTGDTTFESTERNGVVSEQARSTYQRYLVELIEAVPSGGD
ncbi:MAG: hypothetical protein U5R48_18920 [Gammaproteobacteria bacterium]|nr:hypothetical protein [Gammaproteobacteria bacterium]